MNRRKVVEGKVEGGGEGGAKDAKVDEADPKTPVTNAQVEAMVRRRVADALASAGVSPGVISREVLFMLPAEFVQVYVSVFDRALAEGVSSSGMGREGDEANPVRRVVRNGALRDSGKGGRRNAQGKPIGGDTRRGVVQVGAGGGKRRYKDYWVVRDEVAFEVKRTLDRRLRRLAAQVRVEMARGRAGESVEIVEVWCNGCGADLTNLLQHLGPDQLRHCPRCGYWLSSLGK